MAGICVGLACMLAALAAPLASASYDSEIETTTISGTQTETLESGTDVGVIKCTATSFSGTQLGGLKEAGVFATETVTVHPTPSGCTLSGLKVNITTTGCNYKVAEAVSTQAPATLVCEAGKEIVAKDTAGLGCEVKFGSQTPSGQVTFTNAGEGKARDVSWKAALTGLSYSWTAGCPNASGKAGSNTNGTYKATETVKGLNAKAEQVGIWVTWPGSGSYDSEIELTTISGAQTETHESATDVGTIKCTATSFSGTQLGGTKEAGVHATETLTVHPTSSGCTLAGVAVTITTTGCNYKVAEAVSKQAAATLVCEAGKEIVAKDKLGLGCEVKFGSQTASGQITFTNAGAAKTRDVSWKAALTGLAYSWTAGCPNAEGKPGSNTNGTYKGTETVKGLNEKGEQVGIWVT
jgi:hypothetical protein